MLICIYGYSEGMTVSVSCPRLRLTRFLGQGWLVSFHLFRLSVPKFSKMDERHSPRQLR